VYQDETAPLQRYYEDRGLLLSVDGEGTIEEVHSRIENALDERLPTRAA
jgi:adenylate kinase